MKSPISRGGYQKLLDATGSTGAGLDSGENTGNTKVGAIYVNDMLREGCIKASSVCPIAFQQSLPIKKRRVQHLVYFCDHLKYLKNKRAPLIKPVHI